MDKNQAIGFGLIVALLGIYIFFFNPEPQPEKNDDQASKKSEQVDSLKNSLQNTVPEVVSEQDLYADVPDSILNSKMGLFAPGLKGTEQEIVLENDQLKVVLSSKGGRIKNASLKTYKDYLDKPVELISDKHSKMQWKLPTLTPAGDLPMENLYFSVKNKTDKSVTFRLDLPGNKFLEQTYSLDDKFGYVLNYHINASSITANLRNGQMEFFWNDKLKRLEKEIDQSRRYSALNYYTKEDGYTELNPMMSSSEADMSEGTVTWFSMKQRFFNAGLINDLGFEQVKFETNTDRDSKDIVKDLTAQMTVPVSKLNKDSNMRFFFGPNDFDMNQEITEGYENNVYLGWAVFAFISRFLILPLFNLLEGFVGSYGIIIIIMVLIIRGILSPLTYKQYASGARMKLLQPKIKELNEAYKDDAARKQQEQMKLYQRYGVNPLSGCLPLFLQMPIFFALFTFFPNAIQLKGEAFLWANDLSTYDSVLDLPFTIPFYGDHVSLFTLLYTVSQFGVLLLTPQTTAPGGANENMPINPKVMMYTFPVIFLFVLNSYPSGLALYYFTSNLFTVTQSSIIKKFFINEEKLKADLEKNEANYLSGNKKKSKFRQKLDDALKAQQEKAREVEEKKKKEPSKSDQKRRDIRNRGRNS